MAFHKPLNSIWKSYVYHLIKIKHLKWISCEAKNYIFQTGIKAVSSLILCVTFLKY